MEIEYYSKLEHGYAKGIYLKVKHSNPEQHAFRIIFKDTTTCEQVRGANFKNVFSNPNKGTNQLYLFKYLIRWNKWDGNYMGRCLIAGQRQSLV